MLLFFIGISISVICVLAFLFGFSLEQPLLFLAAAISLALLFNFHLVYSLFILLIFVPLQWIFHTSVLFSVIVMISFFVCFPDVKAKDFSNPLNKSILTFILLSMPSLYNSIQPLMSVAMFYNFIGMLVIMYVTMISMDTHKKMMNVIYFYLAGVLLNSFYVIFQAIATGKRVWGFSGIFYVDFVGLAIILSLILFIYSSGIKKIIFSLIMIISIVGLILTQTRNAWISTIVVATTFFLYLLKQSDKKFIKKYNVIGILLVVSLITFVLYFSASSFSTKLETRLSGKAQTFELTDAPESAGENSFIQRAFIWHTATMAFLEHPIIGIGAYSFPFSSQLYYKIPKPFYKTFVQEKTPHITYLAVLTETGAVGFTGFILLLVSVIKLLLTNLMIASKKSDIMRTFLICWAMIYIIISMAMTDAWLFGQQVMIWGIILGLLLANFRILAKKSELNYAL